MIKINDLIHLPYAPDLTEGGITYACRSLPHTYNRLTSSSRDCLTRVTADVAVELAFRRYLNQQNIPFDVKGAKPFTDPDRYDVSLGGHRCDLKSFLISYRSQISNLRADLGPVINAPALVPFDQYSTDSQTANDIYIFAFLTGLIANSQEDIKRAEKAAQPIYLIHTMPNTWTRPQIWIPLGPLVLKSESDVTLHLVIGGQDTSREFFTQTLDLPPNTRLKVDGDFYSLAFIHVNFKPDARLGIYSPSRKETYLIEPNEWSNIWIYGMDIYLTGWISHAEFYRRALLIKEGSCVFQYHRTHVKHLAVSIADLKPLTELFERVREWK
jgi:hypothetical protein